MAGAKGEAKPHWWEEISEKVAVAAVTALATGAITLAGPAVKDWAYSAIHHTNGRNQVEIAFQREKWKENGNCANNPVQAIWHPASDQRQIDATICPTTGDILVVMKDTNGRQFQWWPDLKGLVTQFDMTSTPQVGSILTPAAFAAAGPSRGEPRMLAASASMTVPRLSMQSVVCQIMLPDGRGLRRRLMVGPNQCVEILIDTFTGQVIYQRPVPCVANCAMNV